MAVRGRPSKNNNENQNRVTIVFTDNDILLVERLKKLAIDNNKALSEIIRNVLKIGIDCYDLGFNIGFDGKLIKSDILPIPSQTTNVPTQNEKEKDVKKSVFMEWIIYNFYK